MRGGRNDQTAGFAQQGSVDWVDLGRNSFSASIAILQRLSSAGIEPLTVAVGQVIRTKIPLGIHGEKVLKEAMSSLTAYGSFGNVIWFGIGVRHILRYLVQSAPGAALVALCAELSEGHNQTTSALVIYEIAKRSAPDVTPAFSQWETLVKVCSSIFSGSNMGLRIDIILRLGGYTDVRSYGRVIHNQIQAGHPKDLAEAILAVSNVVSGLPQEIHIRGGPACSWVAVFADQILGLRVSVRSNQGVLLHTNYDSSAAIAQINLQFCHNPPSESIACVGRVFYVRQGNDFIQQCLHGLTDLSSSNLDIVPFIGGRVRQETLLRDTFGKDADVLLLPSSGEKIAEPSRPDASFPSLHPLPLADSDEAFARLFVAGAALYSFFTPEACRYNNPTEYVLRAMYSLPELCSLREKLLVNARDYIKSSTDKETVFARYSAAMADLISHCDCQLHEAALYKRGEATRAVYCLLNISQTALVLTYLLGSLSFDGSFSLMPTRFGILEIYNNHFDPNIHVFNFEPFTNERFSFRTLYSRLTMNRENLDLGHHLSLYVALFSGPPPPSSLGTSRSAINDGKVYCYLDTVRALTDRFEEASMIHVGAGSIQAGNCLHYCVFDEKTHGENNRLGYQAPKVEIIDRRLLSFTKDFTTSDLRIEAVVEESISLIFSYRVSSMKGEIRISPGKFLKETLGKAVEFKARELPGPIIPTYDDISWTPTLPWYTAKARFPSRTT